MSDCEQGKANAKDIVQLKVEMATISEKINSIDTNIKEIKQMWLNDQVGRNQKREQVETNKKDLELAKDCIKGINNKILGMAVVVILACVKLAFFN